jgi:ligand-binding SRPBCC domain-containing protein
VRRIFEHESVIPAAAEKVFAFHERPDALTLLIPPGEPIRVIEHTGGIRDGARVVLQMGYPPFAITWIAIHQGYIEGRQFQDLQQKGPFRYWLHTHTITPLTPDSCRLQDHIEFEILFSPLLNPLIRQKLLRTFIYRHQITALHSSN